MREDMGLNFGKYGCSDLIQREKIFEAQLSKKSLCFSRQSSGRPVYGVYVGNSASKS